MSVIPQELTRTYFNHLFGLISNQRWFVTMALSKLVPNFQIYLLHKTAQHKTFEDIIGQAFISHLQSRTPCISPSFPKHKLLFYLKHLFFLYYYYFFFLFTLAS